MFEYVVQVADGTKKAAPNGRVIKSNNRCPSEELPTKLCRKTIRICQHTLNLVLTPKQPLRLKKVLSHHNLYRDSVPTVPTKVTVFFRSKDILGLNTWVKNHSNAIIVQRHFLQSATCVGTFAHIQAKNHIPALFVLGHLHKNLV